MRTVVKILAAKVPQVQNRWIGTSVHRQIRLRHSDPMRRIRLLFKWLSAQSVANLRFTNPPVADDDHLYINNLLRSNFPVVDMSQQTLSAIVSVILR